MAGPQAPGAHAAPTNASSTSIVIITRNRRPALEEAVSSALDQGPDVLEVIVVDDASSDDTWEWLSGAHDPRLRPVWHERHSEEIPPSARMARARNRGLREVHGRYVMFLDDDDRLFPGSLRRLLGALRRHPGAVFAVGGREVFDDRGARRRARYDARFTMVRRILPDLLAGWGMGIGQWVAPTSVVRDVGAWNELPAAEEWDMGVRLSSIGPAVLIPQTVLEERMHPGQWGWEPPERAEVQRRVRETFPDTVLGPERTAAAHAATASLRLSEAGQAYDDRRFAEALGGYAAAVRTAPGLLVSPLRGPYLAGRLVRSIAGLVVGRRGADALSRFAARSRRGLRRDPEAGGGWRFVRRRVPPGSGRGRRTR
jgi:hypothetical protein